MCDKGIQQMSSLPSLSSYIPITTIERRKRKDPSCLFCKKDVCDRVLAIASSVQPDLMKVFYTTIPIYKFTNSFRNVVQKGMIVFKFHSGS